MLCISSQCLLEWSWCKSDWTPPKGTWGAECYPCVFTSLSFPAICQASHNLTPLVKATVKSKFFLPPLKKGLLLVLYNEPPILLLWQITSVLAWRPHLQSQKWLSCSVQNLEMFSCVLSCEDETALSIIDPTSALVELNNARRQKGRKNAGLLGIAEEQLPSLEVTKLFRSPPREKFRLIFDIFAAFNGFR